MTHPKTILAIGRHQEMLSKILDLRNENGNHAIGALCNE